MLDDLVKSALMMEGGYKVLTQEEIKSVCKEGYSKGSINSGISFLNALK